MRKGTKVIIDWPRVYPPTEGRVISVNGDVVDVFVMGGRATFPKDKLKAIKK